MAERSILVVEDDKALLNGVNDLLEMAGYKVMKAGDGVEALNLLKTGGDRPDLIVSDIFMPNMDGYELLTAVRSHPEWISIPFIFLTAKGEKKDIRDGKLRGVDDYLVKPFDYEDLIVSIERGLNRHDELLEWQDSRMENLRQRILKVINHEFRTPLTYIVAYADLLENSNHFEQSDELRQYIRGIMDGTDRLSRLVENFLILAELESGYGFATYERRKGEIKSIYDIVEKVTDRAKIYAESRKVRIDKDLSGTLPRFVGDEIYLQTAIFQFVENAIKFSPKGEGAVVNIKVHTEGDELVISVCDQGPGIPTEKQKELFELFYQVDRDKTEQQGSGAGLAIVRHVAKLHGAKIKVKSAVGFGSCFELWMPTD